MQTALWASTPEGVDSVCAVGLRLQGNLFGAHLPCRRLQEVVLSSDPQGNLTCCVDSGCIYNGTRSKGRKAQTALRASTSQCGFQLRSSTGRGKESGDWSANNPVYLEVWMVMGTAGPPLQGLMS